METDKSAKLVCSLALAWVALLATAAMAIAAPAPPGSAAEMYEPGRIVVIDLTLPPESEKKLEEDPEGEYQPGTFSLAGTEGTPASAGEFTTPLSVGIRLKGGKGSFRDLTEKAGFKIKFSKAQSFLGLRKMTLNNMVQDPSMVREVRAYEAFRALGVEAPNTGYAFVRVNGEVFGTYLNLETLDKVALEKRFGPFADPQHLYEGEYGDDVGTGPANMASEAEEVADKFEVDEGDEENREDLEALVTAVNEGASGWLERVEKRADLTEMTRMWAVEKYVGHWDGYSGHLPEDPYLLPNNYYLYSDSAGRFQMLPWGTDQTWDERLEFDAPGGVLFNDCLADAGCMALYRKAAGEVLKTIPTLELSNKVRCTAKALRPFQKAEAEAATETRVPPSAELIADRVHADRVFMDSRAAELAAWLEVSAPLVDHSESPCDRSEVDPRPPHPGPTDNSVHLGKVTIASGILRAHLTVDASGSVDLSAGIKTRFGPRRACRRDDRPVAAGFATLRCQLTRAARWLLAAHAARLTVGVHFEAADGSHSSDLRRVTVPRIALRATR